MSVYVHNNSHCPEIETTLREIYSQTADSGAVKNLFSFYLTGGGAQYAHWSFTVPGASNCVCEGNIPYSRGALLNVLKTGVATDSTGACNSETAVNMAKAAYLSTVKYALQNDVPLSSLANANVFGLSCTAALVSDQPKKGKHRCHVSVFSATGCTSYSIDFNKLRGRTRVQEDHLCSRLMLDAAATQCGVALRQGSLLHIHSAAGGTSDDAAEAVEITSHPSTKALDCIDRVAARRATHALFIPRQDGSVGSCSSITGAALQSTTDGPSEALESQFAYHESAPIPGGSIVYSGSFNPLHAGHVQLLLAEIERQKMSPGHGGNSKVS